MKKIYKAINEGLKSQLIDFGNNKILKSEKTDNINLYKFDIGDFVHKDKNYGYNNTFGEKVAICINDDPYLFIIINHVLHNVRYAWAPSDTYLSNTILDNKENGWENTRYIINNYKKITENWDKTIWGLLKPYEYIPNVSEMWEVDKHLLFLINNGIDINISSGYWTSDLAVHNHNLAAGMQFFDKSRCILTHDDGSLKSFVRYALPFLYLDKIL